MGGVSVGGAGGGAGGGVGASASMAADLILDLPFLFRRVLAMNLSRHVDVLSRFTSRL